MVLIAKIQLEVNLISEPLYLRKYIERHSRKALIMSHHKVGPMNDGNLGHTDTCPLS